MEKQYIFNFKTDISKIKTSSKINNPFIKSLPEIARIAAQEFQEFITVESKKWNYNFHTQ